MAVAPEIIPETHAQLVDNLNQLGIAQLADPLEELLDPQQEFPRFVVKESGKEFAAYWIAKENKRLLTVHSNLGRLAGLFLSLPVELDQHQLASGDIIASYNPIGGHPEPYLKKPYSLGVGLPKAVVKVQQAASQELYRALESLD